MQSEMKLSQTIENEIKSKTVATKNIEFKHVKISPYISQDIINTQLECFEEHFDTNYLSSSNRVIELYVCVNEVIFEKYSSLISHEDYIRKFIVFREHTKSQFHYEYLLDDLSVFTSANWNDTLTVKINNNKVALIFKTIESYNSELPIFLVREILIKSAENDNSIIMHGASFRVNNLGILVVGSKGAGKTTLLCNLAESNIDFKFISNDRTIMSKEKSNYKLSYFPMNTRIGWGTVKRSIKLEKFVHKKYKIKCERKANILKGKEESTSKYALTKREFEEFFQKKLVAESDLDLIIFPKIIKNSTILHVEETTIDNAKMELTQNSLTPKDDLFLEDWIIKHEDDSIDFEKISADMISELLKNVKLLNFHYGTDVDQEVISKFFMEETSKWRK